jgi:predicted transcriptional regulator
MENKFILLGRIFASKNRLNILLLLSEAMRTPSGLSTELGLHLSYVSKVLGELVEMSLVECKNQTLAKGRIYGLTKLGISTVEEIKCLEINKREVDKIASK